MTQTVLRYNVQADDTLPRVAQTQLGDATKWTDIAALNGLRPPYISAALPDQLGPVIGQTTLQSMINVGDTQIAAWNTALPGYSGTSTILVPGNIILLTDYLATGDRLYDAAQITTVVPSVVNGQTCLQIGLQPITAYRSLAGRITMGLNGMARVHAVNQSVQVFGNPSLLSTAVAQAGDLIFLPVYDVGGQDGIASISDLADALGTDIAIDQNGQMQSDQKGGLKTVSGGLNVLQAIRARFRTTPGELPRHPDYGFQGWFYVGANRDSSWQDLLSALSYECILSEPRVLEVTGLSVTTAGMGDADLIDISITTATNGQVMSDTIQF